MGRTILDHLLDPLVIIDGHRVIQDASRSTHDVFGWPCEELIGRQVSVLMPKPYRSAHDDWLRRYCETGESAVSGRVREIPVLRRDGREILCELSIARCDDGGAGELRLLGCFRDVTEKRRVKRELEHRESILDAIFEQESKFLGILDLDGRVERLNRSCLVATGQTSKMVRGEFVWELGIWRHDDRLRDRLRQAVERARAGSTSRFDVESQTLQDGRLMADLIVKPVLAGGGARFLLFEAHDVTALRRVQRAEVQMLKSLAEIGEMAADLVHEVKNPITGIRLALRSLAEKLGEEEGAILEDLAARLQRLVDQMQNTLQVARPAQARTRETSANEVLEAALDGARPRLDEGCARLYRNLPKGDFRFHADCDLLQSALSNLLHNAVEAAPGEVRIGISAEPMGEDHVRFTVEDDGPGIPRGQRNAVFQPFVSTKETGSGLGLALVRKATHAHGGSVGLDESEWGGARFTLVLPRNGKKNQTLGGTDESIEVVSG